MEYLVQSGSNVFSEEPSPPENPRRKKLSNYEDMTRIKKVFSYLLVIKTFENLEF